jgi:hypothetical protein
MKQKRVRIGLLLLGLLLPALVAGCADQPGQVELSTTEFDFGTIPNDKAVSQVFEVRNVGRGKLEITGVSTSCGCTSAEVSKRQLARGETAELKEPMIHRRTRGQLARLCASCTFVPTTWTSQRRHSPSA